jgi:hypothetical protein
MGQPQSTGYLGLGNAIANGDLAEVKMWVEKKGLRVNGPPDCDFWDLPLTSCLLQANGKCKHIARYLAGRGAENYDVAAAVEVGDIERVQKLLKGPTPLEKLDRETAGQLLARCTFSGSMDVARYLYHFMGPEKGNDMPGILGTCQDVAYNIRTACSVGDLNRIKKIAVSEHFSINQGFLVRTGNKVHDTIPYTTPEVRKMAEGSQKMQLKFPLELACRRPWNKGVLRYLVNTLKADTEILIEKGSAELRTPLQVALEDGDEELAKILLELGAKAPKEGEHQNAKLHVKSNTKATPVFGSLIVAKDFGEADGGVFYGKVTAFDTTEEPHLHHVVYADGDSEDMDPDEFKTAFKLAADLDPNKQLSVEELLSAVYATDVKKASTAEKIKSTGKATTVGKAKVAGKKNKRAPAAKNNGNGQKVRLKTKVTGNKNKRAPAATNNGKGQKKPKKGEQ